MIRTGSNGTRETDLWSNPLPIASLEQNVYDIRLVALHGLAGCEIRKGNDSDSIAPIGQGSDGQTASFGRSAGPNRTCLRQGFDHEARIARGRGGDRGDLLRLARSRYRARYRRIAAWPRHRNLWTGEFREDHPGVARDCRRPTLRWDLRLY